MAVAEGTLMLGVFENDVVIIVDPVEVSPNCFVLRPVTDPVAREVLALYADMTPNELLRADLHTWLDEIPEEEV